MRSPVICSTITIRTFGLSSIRRRPLYQRHLVWRSNVGCQGSKCFTRSSWMPRSSAGWATVSRLAICARLAHHFDMRRVRFCRRKRPWPQGHAAGPTRRGPTAPRRSVASTCRGSPRTHPQAAPGRHWPRPAASPARRHDTDAADTGAALQQAHAQPLLRPADLMADRAGREVETFSAIAARANPPRRAAASKACAAQPGAGWWT